MAQSGSHAGAPEVVRDGDVIIKSHIILNRNEGGKDLSTMQITSKLAAEGIETRGNILQELSREVARLQEEAWSCVAIQKLMPRIAFTIFCMKVEAWKEGKCPTGVHLVGSLPLPTSTATFTKLSTTLPHHLRRIPDGEPGERSLWIVWQGRFFAAQSPDTANLAAGKLPQKSNFKFSDYGPNVLAAPDAALPPTGYDDAALASWKVFRELREQGVIPPGVRFQVSLPTPLNVVAVHILPAEQVMVEKVYERQLRAALRRIQDEIPAEDLAIQWDCAFEFAILEELRPAWFAPVKKGILERMKMIQSWVDEGVEMGFHLCYGDLGHKHFKEPKDTALLVEMANGICGAAKSRKVDWVHMPVPKDRVDEVYFEPLRGLKLAEETMLYLGLVHAGDEEGTRKRIETAIGVLGSRPFGVATECGMGRTPAAALDDILRISLVVSNPCI